MSLGVGPEAESRVGWTMEYITSRLGVPEIANSTASPIVVMYALFSLSLGEEKNKLYKSKIGFGGLLIANPAGGLDS